MNSGVQSSLFYEIIFSYCTNLVHNKTFEEPPQYKALKNGKTKGKTAF